MHLVDTSFLVAVFDSSDPRQAKAREDLAAAAPAVIPSEILVETLGVLKVKVGRSAASEALEKLVRLPNVTWSECCDFQATLAIYRRFSTLSFPDAIVVQERQARGAQLLTFDENQRNVAKNTQSV